MQKAQLRQSLYHFLNKCSILKAERRSSIASFVASGIYGDMVVLRFMMLIVQTLSMRRKHEESMYMDVSTTAC